MLSAVEMHTGLPSLVSFSAVVYPLVASKGIVMSQVINMSLHCMLSSRC